MTLIQAVINRGEAVHEKELEEQLDLELADWHTRVAEAVACLRHWESVARLLVRSLRSLQKKIPERSEKRVALKPVGFDQRNARCAAGTAHDRGIVRRRKRAQDG